MTSNYHTPIVTGATNAPATINGPLSELDAAITALGGAGGTFTLANGGTSNTTLAVDDATGFVIGASVVYTYDSTLIETNTIANISSNTITLTNTPSGAIADNAVIAQVTPDVAAASIASPYGGIHVPTLSSAVRDANGNIYNALRYGAIADGDTHPLSGYYASLAAAQVDYPHATALTDEMDWAAIQLAVDLALTQGGSTGGTVLLPTGIYMINQQITLPEQVVLRGVGRGATTIRAASSFSFSGTTAMVALGESGTLAHGTRVENLALDADGVAASVCIYSEVIQELSGVIGCELLDFVRYGIWFQDVGGTSIQHFTLRDLELIYGTNATTSTVAVKLDLGGQNVSGIDRITITTSTTVDVGMALDGVRCGVFERIHIENCTVGVLIGDTTVCNSLIFVGCDGVASVGTLFEVSSSTANAGIVFLGVNKNGGTTLIEDGIRGHTVTASPLAMYVVGDVDATAGYRMIIDDFYQDNVAASQTAVQLSNGARSMLSYGPAYIASRAGSITGVGVLSNAARTAGTLTVEVYKNGSATGLQAQLDGTNTTSNFVTQTRNTDTFVAGDRLDIRITTDGSWTPTTADIRGVLDIEQ